MTSAVVFYGVLRQENEEILIYRWDVTRIQMAMVRLDSM